ncbi:hypothetical protein [Streptomyces qinzhouensis]|uniref:Uncharacterized protein n=1 Tax=Streptomyces qinzhouensis TaxID=2599401 RepID=A0A5B8J6H6_9ACTN|nr:hypothetical protein [Streptomyces qinzhouensis]QDY77405.1 hypothetical protein FQU76_13700 [Streptomyces qinzhouensis]
MSTHDEAQAALRRAARVESAALQNSGWYARYLWVFAAGQLVLVPVSLLWQGLVAALVFALLTVTLVGGLSVYAGRQRVVRRGFGSLHGGVIGSWVALFAVAVALGTSLFEGSVPFAVVASLACALPPALAAISEGRRTP